jgi:hypothetical protein
MSSNNGVPTVSPPIENTTSRESPSRLYVFEPGWRVSIKRGSHREFCYMMAPGQNYYHRLLDGELFLHHGDERLCLSCAVRRGIVAFEPRRLRNPIDPSLADFSELPIFDPDSGDL